MAGWTTKACVVATKCFRTRTRRRSGDRVLGLAMVDVTICRVEKERSCPFMVWYYLLVKRYMNTKHAAYKRIQSWNKIIIERARGVAGN